MSPLRSRVLLAGLCLLGLQCTSAAPDPNPPDPPSPTPPAISSFRATPTAVAAGEPVVLSWTVTPDATLEVVPGVGAVTGSSVTVTPAMTTRYFLVARNAFGEATAEVRVLVDAGLLAYYGDGVQASPGTAAAEAPEAFVGTFPGGNPIPDVEVTFTVTGGGGSIPARTAVTSAAGRASPGPWTLGPSEGMNTLVATVPGLAPVTFRAFGVRSSPDVTVGIGVPTSRGMFPESSRNPDGLVAAGVAATFELVSVRATITSLVSTATGESAMTPGTWSCGILARTCTGWVAFPPYDAIPRGEAVIRVRATDIYGNVGEKNIIVTVARSPTMTVTAPRAGAVVWPKVRIEAACVDEDGAACKNYSVSLGSGRSYFVEAPVLGLDVDVSDMDGRAVDIQVVGRDLLGLGTVQTRTVYVESGPGLAAREALPGEVWDYLAPRTLYVDAASLPTVLKVRDGLAGTDERVEELTDFPATSGGRNAFLVDGGAIYARTVTTPTSSTCSLFQWRDRTLSTPVPLDDCAFLRVGGAFAAYSAGGIHRRTVTTGEDVLVSEAPTGGRFDVAANGDVVYVDGDVEGLYRWRGGSATLLWGDPTLASRISSPLTDGAGILYGSGTGCCLPTGWALLLDDGAARTTLVPDRSYPTPSEDYAIAGGWSAFTAPDATGTLQVWRRSPAGSLQRVTWFSNYSKIEAIGGDGTVVVRSSGKRYLAPPGNVIYLVGSSQGRALYRGGEFVVVLGPNVLEVLAVPPGLPAP